MRGQELGQGPTLIVGEVIAPAEPSGDAVVTARRGRLSDEQVRLWVERSCAEQGVPVHVTDVLVLERVRVLITGGP